MAPSDTTRIRLSFNGESVTVRMTDSATTRDFLDKLPVTLDFEDYKGAEKICYPPWKLTMDGAPDGSDPAPGDFTYYAPWGNFALFYQDHGYAEGLVILGSLEAGLEKVAAVAGDLIMTIEKVE